MDGADLSKWSSVLGEFYYSLLDWDWAQRLLLFPFMFIDYELRKLFHLECGDENGALLQ